MTTPSKKHEIICKCPNCGCQEWNERWVDWYDIPPVEFKLKDYLDYKMGLTGRMIFTCGDYVQKEKQFILTCSKCGYTIIKDFEKEQKEKLGDLTCVGIKCEGTNAQDCHARINGLPCPTFSAEELRRMRNK